MIKELKAFLLRGDVVTLAVAVIIGAAFSKIVGSMVDDIIMPLIGMVFGNVNFDTLTAGGINYGKFVTAVVNFILVGTCLFFVVKAAGSKSEDVK
jgi:large conductance mechanosensitive channel